MHIEYSQRILAYRLPLTVLQLLVVLALPACLPCQIARQANL